MSAYLTQYDNEGAIASASTLTTFAPLTIGYALGYLNRIVRYTGAIATLMGPQNRLGYGGTRPGTLPGTYTPVSVPVRIGKRYGVLALSVPTPRPG